MSGFFFSLFEDNESLEGATIGINNFPFEFKGNNTIIRNEGPGIIVYIYIMIIIIIYLLIAGDWCTSDNEW